MYSVELSTRLILSFEHLPDVAGSGLYLEFDFGLKKAFDGGLPGSGSGSSLEFDLLIYIMKDQTNNWIELASRRTDAFDPIFLHGMKGRLLVNMVCFNLQPAFDIFTQ